MNFEMTIRHSSGAVEQLVGYKRLEFKEEGQANDIHLGVISLRLNTITKGVSAQIRTPGTELWSTPTTNK